MDKNLASPMWGGANQARINVFSLEQFGVVLLPISFAGLFRPSYPPLIDIRHGHDTDVIFGRAFYQAVDVASSLAAAADDSDADAVVGSKNTRGDHAGQRD